ncbi:MAG: hypothetical protein A3E01_02990 [Gammaproteobacteria bacterium RIFCSPHIGHO2_12_FULL_63_22]|nr:MAG: hypothetical protein A3E01_02990 [Gammaproteobacteria bacterium RIFCSPHIGHO2_12_FULL_63_22]
MYRQGDVLIVPAKAIPKGVEPISRDKGRVVLAYGEVTGHAHAIKSEKAALFRDPKLAAVFMHVNGGETHQMPRYRQTDNIIGRDDDGEPIFETVIDGYDDVEGVALDHEEHTRIVIPPGDYRIVQQREYSPEAIRNVAD